MNLIGVRKSPSGLLHLQEAKKGRSYRISSRSMYRNEIAVVTAGNTKPTRGTKIEGR